MAAKSKKKKLKSSLATKKRSYKTEGKRSAKMIGVIILLFIAIFIALSVFQLGGSLGSIIRSVIVSAFGTLGVAFPIVIVVAVVLSLYFDSDKLNIKLYALIALYISVICLIDSIINNYVAEEGFVDAVNNSIIRARDGILSFNEGEFSGGAIGTAIVFLLNKAIDKKATIILLAVVTAISLISTFGTKLPLAIAAFFKAIFSFIFSLPRRLTAQREEDKKIAIENEKILKETYEKSRSKNLQVSFDNSFSDTRLVLEPLTSKKKTFDTSNINITPADIEAHFYDAKKDTYDRPQSHLLKELRKKSINEVIYEEKEKGNEKSEFFYTEGMKPVEELDTIVFPKKAEPIKHSAPISNNEYDVDNSDSIYQTDNSNFARGLEDVTRESVIDKESSKKTIANIEKEGIELKNKTIAYEPVIKKKIQRVKKYKFPPLNLLNKNDRRAIEKDPHLNEKAEILVDTLQTFGIGATLLNITVGPAVTRYELKPDVGVKISKILSLENDLQLALAASSLKIEAPIPGKAAIGIEIANDKSSSVLLGDIISSHEFRNAESKLTVAIGKDISGKSIITDLRKMPHVLIAGATGSGKSVCINSIITSLIYKSSPEDVRMIMIDPKVVELQVYDGIPHLLVPVVTNPKKAATALHWAVTEMTRRYNLIQEKRVRDIESYNQAKDCEEKLPYIVIIIDEFADLMMVASKEVENHIMRIAQLARACGIYLVIATQRPSVNVISGSIKTNVPSRISFAVSSGVDSQVILDRRGAEKLLGHGDMLYFPTGIPEPVRVQGCYVSDDEIHDIVEYVRDDDMLYDETAEKIIDSGMVSEDTDGSSESEKDERFVEAGRLIVREQNASIGMIQRKFAMGFNRAARIIDQLESEGVISKQDGKKPREVLMTIEEFDARFGG